MSKHKNIKYAFSFQPIDSHTVNLYLKNINTRKATGFDNIPCKILKIAHEPLSRPLTFLMNASMNQNIFPDLLKALADLSFQETFIPVISLNLY